MATKALTAKKTRLDGWLNLLTGLGNALRDKRLGASFTADRLDWNTERELYRGNDLAARIVETVPDEMVREWSEVKVEGDKGAAEATMAAMDELAVREQYYEAMCWERAYGGAGILLGVDDGQKDLRQPLDFKRIRSLRWLTVLQPRELYATRYYSDALSPKFGQPELFRVQPVITDASTARLGSFPEVHESRVIRFPGIRVDNIQLQENNGWGDSVLNRCHRVITDFDMSWSAAAHLITDFAQAVVQMEGLNELIASNEEDVVTKRAQMMDMTRSVARVLLLDKNDSFERKPTPITGLPEILDRMCNRLAASAKMPVTVLMGQAPAGLNATGASDIRAWYDQVAAMQARKVTPALKYLLRVLFLAKEGPTRGKEPENWSVCHRPLWQLDENAKADIRLKQAQADAQYIQTQVLLPEEVALSRFGGDEYSTDTVVDFDARAELAAAAPEPALDPSPHPEPDTEVDPSHKPEEASPAATTEQTKGAAQVKELALNGAQVQSAQSIVIAVANGGLPRESGVAMLQHFFTLSPPAAEDIMGEVGKGFEPKIPVLVPKPGEADPGGKP